MLSRPPRRATGTLDSTALHLRASLYVGEAELAGYEEREHRPVQHRPDRCVTVADTRGL